MTKTRVLDQSCDTAVADALREFMDDLGFSAEEAIPGMVLAILRLAEFTDDPENALDEAANLLADGDLDGRF